jgi:hypothetical protein
MSRSLRNWSSLLNLGLATGLACGSQLTARAADCDDDSVPDELDCLPCDPTVWSVSGPITQLQVFGRGPTQLTWQPPANPGGVRVSYDLLRSSSGSSFALANCPASDFLMPQALDNEPPPPAGSAYFYLVRAENGCGGALGVSTAGNRREGFGCLQFLLPQPLQPIGGLHALVWATASAMPPGSRPQLEFSTNGVDYSELPPQLAPDIGAGTLSAIDYQQLPSGSVWLRASLPNDSVVTTAMVDRLPVPACQVSGFDQLVDFDASATHDDDGFLTRFEWNFGDGQQSVTATPFTSHLYPAPGRYPLELTACDDRNLCATALYQVLVTVAGAPTITTIEGCGCEEMQVIASGAGEMDDPRRPNGFDFEHPPLGKDPKFVSFNFEIAVVLKPQSNPARCTEGQRVRRTVSIAGDPAAHKQACSAGRVLAVCEQNRDCDTGTCRGGLDDGQPCRNVAEIQSCEGGGGRCQRNNDGVCTAYPLAGGARGNDDYESDSPEGAQLKRHCPSCGSPRWFDSPGQSETKHADLSKSMSYEADFVAFVDGDGDCDCSCHFRVKIGWDGATKQYSSDTGISLVQDAETFRCTISND